MEIQNIKLDKIKIPDHRARKKVEKQVEYKRLKESIEKWGLLHPIIVDKDYELVCGLRRYKVFRDLAMDDWDYNEIPARVMDVDAVESFKLQIAENWTIKKFYKWEKEEVEEALKAV